MTQEQIAFGKHEIDFELLSPTSRETGGFVVWSFPVVIGDDHRIADIAVPKGMDLSTEELAEHCARAVGDELREKVRAECVHLWRSRSPKTTCRLCGVPRVFVQPFLR